MVTKAVVATWASSERKGAAIAGGATASVGQLSTKKN